MAKIKIFIVDDHTVLRVGLRFLIQTQEDMEVVGEATNGREALDKIGSVNPDVAIMDITMPNTNGIKIIEQVLKVCPNMQILVLTMHDDIAYVRATLAAGALGYVTKEAADSELLTAIRMVFQGQMSVDKNLGSSLLQDLLRGSSHNTKQTNQKSGQKTAQTKNLLSKREQDVLQLLAQGFTNKQIADQIHVSVKTVESYRLRLGEKLGLHSRSDLTHYAFKVGLLNPNNFTAEDS